MLYWELIPWGDLLSYGLLVTKFPWLEVHGLKLHCSLQKEVLKYSLFQLFLTCAPGVLWSPKTVQFQNRAFFPRKTFIAFISFSKQFYDPEKV